MQIQRDFRERRWMSGMDLAIGIAWGLVHTNSNIGLFNMKTAGSLWCFVAVFSFMFLLEATKWFLFYFLQDGFSRQPLDRDEE